MKRYFAIVLFCLLSVFLSSSASEAKKVPKWVEALGRTNSYPPQEYLIGFGESLSGQSRAELLVSAKDLARADMARQIRVNIDSLTLQKQQEISGREDSFIQCLTRSTANLRLEGVEIADTYCTKKPGACYARAVLNKREAAGRLRGEVKRLNDEILSLDQKARQAEETNPSRAIEDYMIAKSKLNLARRQIGILLALGGTAIGLERPLSPIEINQRIESLLVKNHEDLELAVTRMAYEITRAIDPKLRILVDQFTMAPGKYSGSLAWYLSEGIQNRLIHPCGYHVVDRDRLTGQAMAAGKYTDMDPNLPEVRARLVAADAVLYGTYREAGDKVFITAYLTDLAKGDRLATTSLEVKKVALNPKGLLLAPKSVPQNIPLPSEMMTPELNVRLWTDRGDGGVYKEEEKMYVYVQANRDCYLRLVYTQADGTNVQIFPNRFKKGHRIEKKKVYTFPGKDDDFVLEITAPFGAEVLQAFACTEPFQKVSGRRISGDLKLLDGERKDIIGQTRGIKVEKREALYTEAKCVVSTIKGAGTY